MRNSDIVARANGCAISQCTHIRARVRQTVRCRLKKDGFHCDVTNDVYQRMYFDIFYFMLIYIFYFMLILLGYLTLLQICRLSDILINFLDV